MLPAGWNKNPLNLYGAFQADPNPPFYSYFFSFLYTKLHSNQYHNWHQVLKKH